MASNAGRIGDARPEWAGPGVRVLAGIGGGSWAVLPRAHNFCYSHPGPAAERLRETVSRWTVSNRPG